ncbi:MAG: PHP domain-containing protein [Eubacteriales bacterium]
MNNKAKIKNEQDKLISELYNKSEIVRLESTRMLSCIAAKGGIYRTPSSGFVNCHIHTSYSFSPYTPAAAVFEAWRAGLLTAGIVDHDSIAGGAEFTEAGAYFGLPTTQGVECRVKVSRFEDRTLNNPDQIGVAYVCAHGVPRGKNDVFQNFLAPYREARSKRNRGMCARINDIISPYGITLDYDADVIPKSMADTGGSVTERHLMYALAIKLAEYAKTPHALSLFLTEKLKLKIPEKVLANIADGDKTPQYYLYDILGALKSELIPAVYIPASDELPDAEQFIDFARSHGALTAYAYLGDVGESVTGDKRAQHFEDAYLDELFAWLKETGFDAVTYMPSRNTKQQLSRVMTLCRSYGFFEISGEDINSPRQLFICRKMADPMFIHLTDTTFALIGHEIAATSDIRLAMNSSDIITKYPSLEERTKLYSMIGRGEASVDIL